MKVNNKEISVNDAINFANYSNILLKHRENNFILSDYQIDILSRNGINYINFSNMEQLLFEIENILNVDYDEELDLVSSQLSELNYYRDTKKWEIFISHFYISFFFICLYSLG